MYELRSFPTAQQCSELSLVLWCRATMREVLEEQLQCRLAQERAAKQHESNCFPDNHVTARCAEDGARPWSSTTQFMTAQQEVRSRFCNCRKRSRPHIVGSASYAI